MPVAAAHDHNPASYPAHLRECARLADGTDILLRPIHPEDDVVERAFISGLSRDSRYNRLLGARKLTPQEIRQLTRIDYEREMAFVAVSASGGQACLLGVARYIRDAHAGGAEFGVVVADVWQRKGVGTLLLQALLRQARAAGIARLHGITFSSNQAMQNLARKLGFVLQTDPQDATVRRVEITLTPEVFLTSAAAGTGDRAAANDEEPASPDLPRPPAGVGINQLARPSAGAAPG